MWRLAFWSLVLLTAPPFLGDLVPLNRINTDQALTGPRSQVRGTFAISHPPMFCRPNVRGEGCRPVMRPTEVALSNVLQHVVDDATKEHDIPSSSFVIERGSTNKKRSLRRAQKRAIEWGYTWYHGRLATPHSLGCQRCHVRHKSPKPEVSSTSVDQWSMTEPRHLRKRCGILTWNASGLSNATLHEVLQWAGPQHIQLVILTETRWQGSRTWQQQGWYCISTSGTPYRSCGIVACVRSSFCNIDNIGWTALHAGRLLHLRLYLQERALDVLCTYQFAYHATHVTKGARKQWFSLLDETLATFPSRNQLVIAGDMNTSLDADRRTVGNAGFLNPDGSHNPGMVHADHGTLQAIMQHHGIVALNTWQSPSTATYYSSMNNGSRIDYICTKFRQADPMARQCTPLRDWPPLPVTSQGHFPVLGNVPLRWSSQQGCTLSTVGYAAKETCRLARRLNQPGWDDFCTASKAFLEDTVWPSDGNFAPIHQGLTGLFRTHFSPVASPTTDFDARLARTKWDLRRALQALQGSSVKHCFQAWKLVQLHQTWTKRHSEALKQKKNDRLQSLLDSAEDAARKHDMSRLYHIINRLTPKTKPDRIQLRSEEGHLLGPTESFQVLCRYVSNTWYGAPMDPITAPAPGVPFSESDLARTIRRTKGMKSMAPHKSPGFSLIGTADIAASKLMLLLQQWWNVTPPFIPQEWREHTHQCSPLFQLASLFASQDMDSSQRSATICLHCAQTFPSEAQLTEHLRTEHTRFSCIRDTVRGNPQCRHCGTDFKEIWELQRHINRGSCNCIDYLADQQGILRKEETMLETLLWGTWHRFIESANHRMLLTITCTMCGQGLKRSADLMRRILTQHGPFHKAAENFTALLEETQPGCCCNPATAQQRRSHRCMAHRQTAMLHHVLNPGHLQVLVPWETAQHDVIQLLACNPQLLAQAPNLATWIGDRTFDKLWMDSLTCKALSHCCSACNRTFSTPHMLLEHLSHQHGDLTSRIAQLLLYVSHHVRAQGLGIPCTLCGADQITYQLEDNTAWAKLSHKCPTILNLCLILAQLGPYGTSRGTSTAHRGRSHLPAPGSILKYARTSRSGRCSTEGA